MHSSCAMTTSIRPARLGNAHMPASSSTPRWRRECRGCRRAGGSGKGLASPRARRPAIEHHAPRRRGNRRLPRPLAARRSRKLRSQADGAKQRLALLHAGRIDLALDLLRQAHGLSAVQPPERHFRMRFDDALPEIRPLRAAARRSRGSSRRCRRPGSTRRAADRMSSAPPRSPCDAPRTSARPW